MAFSICWKCEKRLHKPELPQLLGAAGCTSSLAGCWVSAVSIWGSVTDLQAAGLSRAVALAPATRGTRAVSAERGGVRVGPTRGEVWLARLCSRPGHPLRRQEAHSAGRRGAGPVFRGAWDTVSKLACRMGEGTPNYSGTAPGQTARSWGSRGGLRQRRRGEGSWPRAGSGAGRPRARLRVCWRCSFLPRGAPGRPRGRQSRGALRTRPSAEPTRGLPRPSPGPRPSSQAGRRRTLSNKNRKRMESHDVWLNVLEAFNQVHMLKNPPEGIYGHTRGLGPGPKWGGGTAPYTALSGTPLSQPRTG